MDTKLLPWIPLIAIGSALAVSTLAPEFKEHTQRSERTQYEIQQKESVSSPPPSPSHYLEATPQAASAPAANTPDSQNDQLQETIVISTVVQAICAIALVIFTGLLARYGYRSWRAAVTAADAAKKSADVAEATLILSNRPWLDVSDWVLLVLQPDVIPHVKFKIHNFGKSPAWITRLQLKLTTIDAGTEFPPVPNYSNWVNLLFQGISGCVIAPGTFVEKSCLFARHEFSAEDYRRVTTGLTSFWIFGLINYEDFLEESHETAFSAQYGSFITPDGVENGVWSGNAGPSTYHYHDRYKYGQKNTGLSEPQSKSSAVGQEP